MNSTYQILVEQIPSGYWLISFLYEIELVAVYGPRKRKPDRPWYLAKAHRHFGGGIALEFDGQVEVTIRTLAQREVVRG